MFLKCCFLIFIIIFFFHLSLSFSGLPQPISGSDDAKIGSDGDGIVDRGVDFGVGEEGNDVLEVVHLAAKLVGLGVNEDELIDGLHVCTYRAFLKSLNFYFHLPRSVSELWEDRSNLGVGAEKGDRCLFRGAASASDLVFSGGRERGVRERGKRKKKKQ